ncbi:hypothetical protein [Sedimentitalea nanhaiensis]|uniref:Uncharacterized protein n=2 Tax=Sedimentitalea nanhaiensis TaxID=999627 RepID=A0A1I7AZB3_9RHOB|nr:hypothetical protein [Sedimentitalea nanhaiensis]SFT80234.1 hypothetical protein SAMN05216236_10837 [Sedimentitalea nanhaiensis]
MTSSSPPQTATSPRKVDYKFWTIAVLIVSGLGFNVIERLVLDADEADISYARLIVPANRVTDPHPGDIFVFNHENDAFVESKFCSLQYFEEPQPISEHLTASNLWGSSVNDTIASMADYVPNKISGLARVDNAEKTWTYSKTHRKEVRAPMEAACLQTVVATAFNPNLTPFVVDAIYQVDDAVGQSKWVRFANPLMLDPASCQDGCPQPKRLKEIVQADAITRFKAAWGIVRIE